MKELVLLQLDATLQAAESATAQVRDEAVQHALAALDAHLEEPLEECLAVDRDGRPCIEAKTPQTLLAHHHARLEGLAQDVEHAFHRVHVEPS